MFKLSEGYDIRDVGEEVKEKFSWDSVLENLPAIAAFGIGIFIIDKMVDIGGKLKPLGDFLRKYNESDILEFVDTVGDNMQLFNRILGLFNISIAEVDLDKIADFLQDTAAVGKLVSTIFGGFKGRFKHKGKRSGQRYLEQ